MQCYLLWSTRLCVWGCERIQYLCFKYDNKLNCQNIFNQYITTNCAIWDTNFFAFYFHEACPGNQIRFEDNCFDAAANDPANIITNADACKAKNGNLWVPVSSAEHHFVTQTFQSSNNLYHLGVVKYMV